ncbi:MAG TPA: diguanylate cyclase [Rhodocyclaceae bacterium]|nr:diguanylate cyclase [Rhodocyclaceae bacterium]
MFTRRARAQQSAVGGARGSGYVRLGMAALAAALLWTVAAWFIAARHHDTQAEELVAIEAREADRLAESAATGVDRILSVRRGVALAMAQDNSVRRAAAEGHGSDDLTRFLAAAQDHLSVDALWVGNAAGHGIAASTTMMPYNPVGVDYSDRTYFKEARAGRVGYQYAVGRTSGLGGVFFAAPILNDGRFAGFVVTKTNTARLSIWIEQANAFLADGNGVIVLAADPRLEMHALPDATIERLSPGELQRQYARMDFPRLRIDDWPIGHYAGLKRIGSESAPVLLRSRELSQNGLRVTVMRPVPGLTLLGNQRTLIFLLLAGVGSLVVASLAASTMYLGQLHQSRRLLAYQKQQLDEAQEVAHLGSWEYDLTRNRVVWSEESRRIFELPEGLYGSSYENFLATLHPDDRDTVDRVYRDSVNRRMPGEVVHRLKLHSGRIKLVHERWQTHYDEDGNPERSTGSVQDVTESRQVEARLRLAASVFDYANEGICITDANQRIIDVNPTLCELTGFSRQEMLAQTPRLFKSGRQDAGFYQAMWQAIAEDGHWRGDLWNRHRNGNFYAVRLTVSAVHDAAGALTHYIGIMVNITASKQHLAQLERVAHLDALTGIPNRLLLADRMRQAVAQTHRGDSFLAVCYLDLDEFKPINDQHGHNAGDLVLAEVARRLATCVRGGDTVARIGGDEFALLLMGLRSTAEYEATLRRVLEAVRAPLAIDGVSLGVSASIGVALCPQHGCDPETLLRDADDAMYRAKQGGRNRCYVFDPGERSAERKDPVAPVTKEG